MGKQLQGGEHRNMDRHIQTDRHTDRQTERQTYTRTFNGQNVTSEKHICAQGSRQRYILPLRAHPTFPKGVGDVIISALAGLGINSETSKFEDYKACSV